MQRTAPHLIISCMGLSLQRLHGDAPTAPAPVKPADDQVGQTFVRGQLCRQ